MEPYTLYPYATLIEPFKGTFKGTLYGYMEPLGDFRRSIVIVEPGDTQPGPLRPVALPEFAVHYLLHYALYRVFIMYTYTYIYIYVYTYVYMYIFMYTHIEIHMHTH